MVACKPSSPSRCQPSANAPFELQRCSLATHRMCCCPPLLRTYWAGENFPFRTTGMACDMQTVCHETIRWFGNCITAMRLGITTKKHKLGLADVDLEPQISAIGTCREGRDSSVSGKDTLQYGPFDEGRLHSHIYCCRAGCIRYALPRTWADNTHHVRKHTNVL